MARKNHDLIDEDAFKRIVKEAIVETFTSYGFTTGDPRSMQDDMAHLRKLRLGCEATKRNLLKAFITVTVPAALYIIWESFKHKVNGN